MQFLFDGALFNEGHCNCILSIYEFFGFLSIWILHPSVRISNLKEVIILCYSFHLHFLILHHILVYHYMVLSRGSWHAHTSFSALLKTDFRYGEHMQYQKLSDCLCFNIWHLSIAALWQHHEGMKVSNGRNYLNSMFKPSDNIYMTYTWCDQPFGTPTVHYLTDGIGGRQEKIKCTRLNLQACGGYPK